MHEDSKLSSREQKQRSQLTKFKWSKQNNKKIQMKTNS